MQPLTLSTFIIESLLFTLVVYFYFYLPGAWILNKLRLTPLGPERIVIPLTTGMLLFTLASYGASWMGALPLVFVPIIAIAIVSIKNRSTYPSIDTKHNTELAIVAILAIFWSLPKTITGIWGNTIFTQGDDLLHLAYSNELKAHFPPDNPGFAGVPLLGYHFFSDFLIAVTSTLSGISVESLYFHYFPILISLGVGFGVYSLIVVWTKRKSAGLWGVFLALFGGSFGFILRLQGHSNASLTSVFGIDQPSSALLNAPFAISLLLLTLALLFLVHYSRDGQTGWLYLLALVTGLSPMFKIYAGILLFGGFTALTFVECIRKKFMGLVPFILSIILALTTYGVFSGSGNYLIFLPLWETHKVLTDSLPWFGFEEKYYTYTTLSVTRKLIEIEAIGLALFIFGNLGTRLIGILVHAVSWFARQKYPSLFAVVTACMIITSLLIPLLFIQSVKVFEIIQLSWYYPFLTALVAAFGLSLIRQKVLIVLIIILTLPSTYEIYMRYVISPKERRDITSFTQYEFLGSHGTYNDTVLELPSMDTELTNDQLRLWFQKSSPHIPAYANKRSYASSMQIDFPNMDIEARLAFIEEVLRLASPSGQLRTDASNMETLGALLRKNKIKYLYAPDRFAVFDSSRDIRLVFDSRWFIYEVQ